MIDLTGSFQKVKDEQQNDQKEGENALNTTVYNDDNDKPEKITEESMVESQRKTMMQHSHTKSSSMRESINGTALSKMMEYAQKTQNHAYQMKDERSSVLKNKRKSNQIAKFSSLKPEFNNHSQKGGFEYKMNADLPQEKDGGNYESQKAQSKRTSLQMIDQKPQLSKSTKKQSRIHDSLISSANCKLNILNIISDEMTFEKNGDDSAQPLVDKVNTRQLNSPIKETNSGLKTNMSTQTKQLSSRQERVKSNLVQTDSKEKSTSQLSDKIEQFR